MLVVVGAGRRLAAVASNQLEAMLRRDATAAAAEMFQEEDGDASLSVSLEIQSRRHKKEEEDTSSSQKILCGQRSTAIFGRLRYVLVLDARQRWRRGSQA